MDTEVKLYMEEKGSHVSADEFIDATSTFVKLLKEIESDMADNKRSNIEWVIKQLEGGSATIALGGITKSPVNYSVNDVVTALLGGLDLLSKEDTLPPNYTDDAIEHAKTLASKVGTSFKSVTVSALEKVASLTGDIVINSNKLLTATITKEYSSITGTLKLISIYDNPYYRMVDVITGEKVRCDFKIEEKEKVLAAMGHHMVTVEGLVYYDSRGKPKKVKDATIEFVPPVEELPTTEDIINANIDLSGGLSLAEFLEKRRRERH